MRSKALPSRMRARAVAPTIMRDVAARGPITLLVVLLHLLLVAVRGVSWLRLVTIGCVLLVMITSPALSATATATTTSASLTTTTITSSALSKIAESRLLWLLHVGHRVELCGRRLECLLLWRWVSRVVLINLIREIVQLMHGCVIDWLWLILIRRVRLGNWIVRCITTENSLKIARARRVLISQRRLISILTSVWECLCNLFSYNGLYSFQDFINHVRLIERLFDRFILHISSILQCIAKM